MKRGGETAFGGEFETKADYRDPYLQKLIAEKGGWMVWPPIRYSYATHNLDLPTPAPSKPTWMLTEAQCKEVVQKKGLKSCRDLEYNWLGTDDQSRDVVARLIYGFRISVLFGLTLTILSSIIGIAAATKTRVRRIVGVEATGINACPCAQGLVRERAAERDEIGIARFQHGLGHARVADPARDADGPGGDDRQQVELHDGGSDRRDRPELRAVRRHRRL